MSPSVSQSTRVKALSLTLWNQVSSVRIFRESHRPIRTDRRLIRRQDTEKEGKPDPAGFALRIIPAVACLILSHRDKNLLSGGRSLCKFLFVLRNLGHIVL